MKNIIILFIIFLSFFLTHSTYSSSQSKILNILNIFYSKLDKSSFLIEEKIDKLEIIINKINEINLNKGNKLTLNTKKTLFFIKVSVNKKISLYEKQIIKLSLIDNNILIEKSNKENIINDKHPIIKGNVKDNNKDILVVKEKINIDYTNFGISFPPVSNSEQLNFSEKHLNELGVKLVRFSVHWKFIEKTKGVYNWSGFDERMKFVKDNNFSLLLTIEANGGSWVCSDIKNNESCVFENNKDLEGFVKKLLDRYPNQISKLQFGNEMLSPKFYAGTTDDYINSSNTVYEVVKDSGYDIQYLIGGFSVGVLRRYTSCSDLNYFPMFYKDKIYKGNNLKDLCEKVWVKKEINNFNKILKDSKYDLIDLHLYDDVENWKNIYDFVNKNTSKSIIISEFGGPLVYDCNSNTSICKLGPTEIKSDYSDEYHNLRLKEYIDVIKNLGVKEAYYFKLVEKNIVNDIHTKSGLINIDLKEKSAYNTFKNIE